MWRSMRPYLGILVLCSSLSACFTIQLTEKDLLKPDARTGFQHQESLQLADLQKIVPEVKLDRLQLSQVKDAQIQGIRLQAYDKAPTVLYFGGNLFHLDQSASYLLRAAKQCQVNLIMYDHRGSGRSSGSPNVENMRTDALAIYDQSRQQVAGKLIVHGQSLGSFVAGYLAQQRPLDGLVLETTGTTIQELGDAMMPWYASPFAKVEVEPALQVINNPDSVRQFSAPALVLSGEKDQTTPAALGQKVYQALPPGNKRYYLSPGAGHNGMLARKDVQQEYCAFLNQFK